MGVLDGKAAIVTGSARGIGRATAELLVAQGAQVLINDLDGAIAEQASGEISGETAVFAGALSMHVWIAGPSSVVPLPASPLQGVDA